MFLLKLLCQMKEIKKNELKKVKKYFCNFLAFDLLSALAQNLKCDLWMP